MNFAFVLAGAAMLSLASGCKSGSPVAISVPSSVPSFGGSGSREIVVTPQAIPGTPRSNNHAATGGYAPTNVQAQLKINVSDGTKEVKVIRDNNDPFVITKPYMLKHADPYAVRSYLEAAVGAKSVNASPAQVTAVKFSDGAGAVLVSAEEYRFADSKDGKGIDGIIASLDRPGLTFLPDADAHIYFPRISRAANLRDMLIKVGSSELDPQFAVAPGSITVDPELNALIVKAPKWNWAEMRKMLSQYDRAIPEFKISYRVLEIYAENDDRIGVDFQSWKNNEGVDLFSAGSFTRRNWGTFFSSAIENSGNNRTSYWNFNPKWNTRYLDFMTSIGKAKCLAQGELVVQNRKTSGIQVNSGFFYDRTFYKAGATTIAEGCTEFVYTDPNPDAILRESTSKIVPLSTLNGMLGDMGVNSYLTKAGYTMRVMGTQVGTATYYDAIAKKTYSELLAAGLPVSAAQGFEGIPISTLEAKYAELQAKIAGIPEAYLPADVKATKAALEGAIANKTMKKVDSTQAAILANSQTSAITKYLTGYVDAEGNRYSGNYYRENYGYVDAAPGIIHGWLQYPMPVDGFSFNFQVTPVITGKAASMKIDLSGISLMGWNGDGSARRSSSQTSTVVQLPYTDQEFVIGGIRKSESVRSTAGLPFVKDLPVIGRAFSTESESIKQSQLVVLARVEYSKPDSFAGAEIREELGKIVKGVNKGMTSKVGNMFFQQYGLDDDREARIERLEEVGKYINDDFKTVK